MHSELTKHLRCLSCRGGLELEAERFGRATGQVEEGRLRCPSCGGNYPITGGIVRFVDHESYSASFGRQWTRYAVERTEEDEETFEAKTGYRLGDLAGRVLLDAGCGGGRYTLVAARHGARVLAVDMSRSVDRAARLCADYPHVDFLQADLMHLPLAADSVDLAFSIGVLHHSGGPAAAFRHVAATVRPGGRLAIWVYRRNTWLQELINSALRGFAGRMSLDQLETLAMIGAMLGSIPLLNRTLNKLVNFSNHPVWENRICDTFDWYSPRYQSHHKVAEVEGWFRAAGFGQLQELRPPKSGRLYRLAYQHGLIVGSGVNMVGTKMVSGDW